MLVPFVQILLFHRISMSDGLVRVCSGAKHHRPVAIFFEILDGGFFGLSQARKKELFIPFPDKHVLSPLLVWFIDT